MANIGCRYVYFQPDGGSPISLGKALSVSVNMNRTQLSALNNYGTRLDGANVSIQTDRMPNASVFNVKGSLYWCIVRVIGGTKDYLCCKIGDTVIQQPDYSTATESATPQFNTYTITGRSKTKEEVSYSSQATASAALTLIQAGW